jgi:chemotaxis signal transduction protein
MLYQPLNKSLGEVTMQASAQLNDEFSDEPNHVAEKGRCLLIRVDSHQLIVPRTLVAEVIRYEGSTLMTTAHPDIKLFNWRGFQVPLLNTRLINPACSQETTDDSKLILFHGLLNHGKLPYYGFVVSRNPRLVMVTEDSVVVRGDQQDLLPSESARVTVEEEAASIPKVDFLEKFILDNFISVVSAI